jgi:hypothetical protein
MLIEQNVGRLDVAVQENPLGAAGRVQVQKRPARRAKDAQARAPGE